eukprot:COSAG01_NODE_11407_length_1941_cov_183.820304_3_plen_36_part_01
MLRRSLACCCLVLLPSVCAHNVLVLVRPRSCSTVLA